MTDKNKLHTLTFAIRQGDLNYVTGLFQHLSDQLKAIKQKQELPKSSEQEKVNCGCGKEFIRYTSQSWKNQCKSCFIERKELEKQK